MTKKILALALAGTTAFSVFASAMSVNAAAPAITDVGYKPVTLSSITASSISVANLTGVTDGAVAVGALTTATPADMAAVTTELDKLDDLDVLVNAVALGDDALASTSDGFNRADDHPTTVINKIFLYDYVMVTNAKADNLYDAIVEYKAATTAADKYVRDNTFVQDDAEDILERVEAARAAIYAQFYAVYNPGTVNDNAYTSGRAKIASDFKSLQDDIQPVDNYQFTTAEANYYSKLYTVVKDTDRESVQSSIMVYLLDEYDRVMEDVTVADSTAIEDQIARYIDVLDARVAEDYKNAYEYNGFLKEYGELTADYEGVTAKNKLTTYASDLFTLIKKNTGTAADSSDAKDTLKSLLEDAQDILNHSDDYNTESDAWQTFRSIREEAIAIRDLSKARSYTTTLEAYTELLTNAINDVAPNSSVSEWVWVRLEAAISAAEELVETDYTSTSWKKMVTALTRAQNLVGSGTASKTVINNAADALEKAMDPGLNVKAVPAATKKALKDAIIAAKAKLNEIDGTANSAAQVLALSTAITNANALWENPVTYASLKAKTLISAVEAATTALTDALTSAAQPQGWYTTEAGAWMYGEGDGYYVDGWKKIGNFWFHFDANGIAKQNEWMSEGGKWYYFGNSCVAYAGWGKVDGSWYYFDKGNAMCTGWIKLGNTWYYLDPTSGKMVTGWATIGGTSYYFSTESSTLGAMLVSTTTPDGYTVDANGAWVK